jgi:hypothetical protein
VRLLGSALRLTAATVLVAAVGLALPTGPASAATCSTGGGVTVVVDFHELGGGVQTACVADGGGRSAASLFSAAGFALSYVQRQPGFVCRVNGQPANDPCVNTPPADAYWGLFWSDGKSGAWNYATTAASGLNVPDGGYVAFSWNGSTARVTPGLSPAAHAAVPTGTPTSRPTKTPTGKPTTKPTTKPTARPTTGSTGKPSSKSSSKPSTGPSASATGTATPSTTPSTTDSSAPSSSATKAPGSVGQPTKPPGGVDGEMLPESDPSAPAEAEPAESADDGLPTWVGPVVVVVLFAAGGAVAVGRRRRNPTP